MSHSMVPVAAFAAFLMPPFPVATPAAAQQVDATIATPDSVKWNPAPFPGITIAVAAGNPTANGMYAIFVKFAPGAQALPHTHPDQRIVTVLSGLIHVGIGTAFDQSKAMVLKAGSVVIIPADAPHYGWTTDSEAVLQEVGTAPTGTNIWPKAAAK
jgi:quercetin dioxygenase-like cupin family protein